MTPPINFGGDTVDAVTIDGDSVTSVTVDGSTVFSTIPDSVVAQYNAQELSGFADGDSISTRPDQSANGFDATGSGTYRASGINGYASVDYNGSSDEHDISFKSISQRVVVLAVVEPESTTETGSLNTIAAPASNRSRMAGPAFGSAYNIDAGSSGSNAGSKDTDPHLITGIFDGSQTELREDGSTVIGPASLGTTSWDGITIGAEYDGAANSGFYEGLIGFVEIHDGDPSNGLTTREQDVAGAWDITI